MEKLTIKGLVDILYNEKQLYIDAIRLYSHITRISNIPLDEMSFMQVLRKEILPFLSDPIELETYFVESSIAYCELIRQLFGRTIDLFNISSDYYLHSERYVNEVKESIRIVKICSKRKGIPNEELFFALKKSSKLIAMAHLDVLQLWCRHLFYIEQIFNEELTRIIRESQKFDEQEKECTRSLMEEMIKKQDEFFSKQNQALGKIVKKYDSLKQEHEPKFKVLIELGHVEFVDNTYRVLTSLNKILNCWDGYGIEYTRSIIQNKLYKKTGEIYSENTINNAMPKNSR